MLPDTTKQSTGQNSVSTSSDNGNPITQMRLSKGKVVHDEVDKLSTRDGYELVVKLAVTCAQNMGTIDFVFVIIITSGQTDPQD